MELITEAVKLATAIVLLAAALAKMGSESKAGGSRDREDKRGRHTR